MLFQGGHWSPAETLQRGLHPLFQRPRDGTPVQPVPAPDLLMQRLADAAVGVGSLLRPQGETSNDDHPAERVANVLTSLPFIVLGAHMHSKRRSPAARQYARSLMAVGCVATAYHASWGKLRPVLRKADYWTISLAGACLGRAVHRERRWARRALTASALAVPFFPFHMSTLYTLAAQFEFARCAARSEPMRRAFRRHAAASVAAATAFAVEDPLAARGLHGAHSLWHLLATASVATLGALVEHKEGLAGKTGASGVHDSFASLEGLAGGSPRSPWAPCSGKATGITLACTPEDTRSCMFDDAPAPV